MPSIDLIELPRLKLSFTARPDHLGVLRLYSVDHVDIYITNERNSLTSKMLAGIPHSLLLSNVRGETQVLVPVIPPYRPFIGAEPFSTFIVLNRKAIPLSERFFLYPVHVSLSFFTYLLERIRVVSLLLTSMPLGVVPAKLLYQSLDNLLFVHLLHYF